MRHQSTTPVNAHRKPHHPATHARQERKAQADEMKYQDMRQRGMKATLCRFKTTYDNIDIIPATWYLVEAINELTGEIRYYATPYVENIRYIGNTDYLAYNREPTTYNVYYRTPNEVVSWHILATRRGGVTPQA